MRNYAKTGKKPGKPAYRAPSSFIARQKQALRKIKAKQNVNQSKSLSQFKKTRNKPK